MFDLFTLWFPPAIVLWISGSYLYAVAVKGRRESAVALATHAIAVTGWLVFGSILTLFTTVPPALWYLAAAFLAAGAIFLIVRWPVLRDRSIAVTRRDWMSFTFAVVCTGCILFVRLT